MKQVKTIWYNWYEYDAGPGEGGEDYSCATAGEKNVAELKYYEPSYQPPYVEIICENGRVTRVFNLNKVIFFIDEELKDE